MVYELSKNSLRKIDKIRESKNEKNYNNKTHVKCHGCGEIFEKITMIDKSYKLKSLTQSGKPRMNRCYYCHPCNEKRLENLK